MAVLIALPSFLDCRFRLFSFPSRAIVVVITGVPLLVKLSMTTPSIRVGGRQVINSIYAFAADYVTPMATILLLMTADLRSLRRVDRPAITAFVLRSVGTLVGAFVSGLLLAGTIGQNPGRPMFSSLAAKYVAGSTTRWWCIWWGPPRSCSPPGPPPP